jgi:hypothetical protein
MGSAKDPRAYQVVLAGRATGMPFTTLSSVREGTATDNAKVGVTCAGSRLTNWRSCPTAQGPMPSWLPTRRIAGPAPPPCSLSGPRGAVAARCERLGPRRSCHPRAISSGHQWYPADSHGHSVGVDGLGRTLLTCARLHARTCMACKRSKARVSSAAIPPVTSVAKDLRLLAGVRSGPQ